MFSRMARLGPWLRAKLRRLGPRRQSNLFSRTGSPSTRRRDQAVTGWLCLSCQTDRGSRESGYQDARNATATVAKPTTLGVTASQAPSNNDAHSSQRHRMC